jgi:CheY-like chemotaxis protein
VAKRKLLLADDSVTIQKVVNLTFADEGIEVITVGDGDAAMERFVENVPDLVLVDVNMPGLDGYRICEMIKQDDETRHIPVILLVGSFEPFDEEEARRVGADDYLTKPFQSIRQLVSKVSGLLDPKNKTESNGETVSTLPNSNTETSSVNAYQTLAGSNQNSDKTAQFGDAGMDDETIQTNQIGSLPAAEAEKFSASFSTEDFSQISVRKPSENFVNYETEEKDWAKTQPLNAEEMREIRSVSGERDTAPLEENANNQNAAFGETIPAFKTDSARHERQAQTQQTSAIQTTSAQLYDTLQTSNTSPETQFETARFANLSPEMIDQIAAKVVEKLSDRAIEEIVRQKIAPQLADLIVQRLAREKSDE